MTDQEWDLTYYITDNERIPYREWIESLSDAAAQDTILARLARLRAGNFGKCKSVRPGIFELKIYYGPGYRIYFARTGYRIVLLLCGGNKSTQKNDIRTAWQYWNNYKEGSP